MNGVTELVRKDAVRLAVRVGGGAHEVVVETRRASPAQPGQTVVLATVTGARVGTGAGARSYNTFDGRTLDDHTFGFPSLTEF